MVLKILMPEESLDKGVSSSLAVKYRTGLDEIVGVSLFESVVTG